MLSGQMQFTMEELAFALDGIELSIPSSFNEETWAPCKWSPNTQQPRCSICGSLFTPVSGSHQARPELLIAFLSLVRALANRALTVPAGTPRRYVVSRMLKPSTARS